MTKDSRSSHMTAGELDMAGSIQVRRRANLTVQHIHTAAHLARLALAVEEEQSERSSSDLVVYRGYVAAAVILSVAAIEAVINQFKADVEEGDSVTLARITPSVAKLLSMTFGKVPPALDRYQLALVSTGQPEFIAGEDPYQAAAALVRLRNALIHFEPQWEPYEGGYEILEKRLRGKFAESPLVHGEEPFFPRRCLSGSCARWSVESAWALIHAFVRAMGLETRFPTFAKEMPFAF